MDLLNDQLFRALFDNGVPRIILKADSPKFTIVADNEAHRKITNTTERNIIGLSLWEAFNPDDAGSDAGQVLMDGLNQAILTGKMVNMPPFHYDIPSADGSGMELSWWQVDILPVTGDSGKVEWIINSTSNITEKVTNTDRYDQANNRAQDLTEELEATHEELSASNEELTSTVEELLQSQSNLQMLNNDLEIRVSQRTHRLKSMIMTSPVGMTVLRTTDLVVDMANQGMLTIWNRQMDDVIGNKMIDIFPELDGQPFIDMLVSVIETGKSIVVKEMEAIISTTDGTLKNYHVDFSYDALFDEEGNVEGLLATVMDITDRVEARKALEISEAEQQALNEELKSTNEELASINEEHTAINEELRVTNDELFVSQQSLSSALKEIKHNEQRLNDILGQLPAMVVVLTGPDQVVELANKTLLKFWRKTWDEVKGRPVLTIFPELKNQPFPAQWRHVYNTGEQIINREKPVTFLNPDGSPRLSHVDYYYQPTTDADGNRIGVLATVLDVSDKVEARKKLEEAQAEQQALNEELISTNEELSATVEELAESQQILNNTLNELAESESRLRYMLSEAPVAIAVMEGRELIVESANKMVLQVWGKKPDIIGKPLHLALPELQGQPFLQILDSIFDTAEPFYGNEMKAMLEVDGVLEEIYTNFVYYPLKNNDDKVTSIMLVASIVTEQVLARQKLQGAEEMLRFSIEAANVGTWFMDVDKHEFIASARLKELFGFYPDEEVPFELITQVIPEGYRDKVKNAIDKAIKTGENYVMEHPVTGYHDQKQRWVRGLGKLYPDSQGNLNHFSGLVIDITEQKQDELRKNDFIGMVSHELKTPLTTITAIVQMLNMKAKKSDDTMAAGMLQKANTQVKKMANMINGFLNISRLESGKIQLEKQQFDLEELVKITIDENQVISPSHNITLVPCDTISLFADKDKIGSVISNLLSNAVKYSAKDTDIQVKCELKNNLAHISVTDQGIGIKPHDREKLFERYYRVQNSHHVSGFGIGLYLSAEIVHRHNGEIGVYSEEGKGSTFWFSLPLE